MPAHRSLRGPCARCAATEDRFPAADDKDYFPYGAVVSAQRARPPPSAVEADAAHDWLRARSPQVGGSVGGGVGLIAILVCCFLAYRKFSGSRPAAAGSHPMV